MDLDIQFKVYRFFGSQKWNVSVWYSIDEPTAHGCRYVGALIIKMASPIHYTGERSKDFAGREESDFNCKTQDIYG